MAITQSAKLFFLIEPPNNDPTLTWAPNIGVQIYFDFGGLVPVLQVESYDSGAQTWVISLSVYITALSVDGGNNLVGTTTSISANLTGISTISAGEHTLGVNVVNGAVQLTVDGWDVSAAGGGVPRHGPAYTSHTITEGALPNGKYGNFVDYSGPYPVNDGLLAVGDLVPPGSFPFFLGASPAYQLPDIRTYFMNPTAPGDPSLANLTTLYVQESGAAFWTNRYLSVET